MAIDAKLTILLTLKGRHLFTLRWLWHANRIGVPFRIFIADGDVHPTIARLIEDRSVFSNLQIEYHRYNDRTFFDFYQKLDDALSRISTPYVMMADNDDFLFPSGIIRSLQYLEHSSDYVCAGGCVAHFEAETRKDDHPNLSGIIKKFWYQQSKAYQAFDLDSSLTSERAMDVYAFSLTVHYNVYRLDALCCIASEQLKDNFSRLESSELFWKLRTATLGKLKSDPSYISYLRQVGTSSNLSQKSDFINTLVNEAYLKETRTIVKRIASIAARSDGVSPDVIEKMLSRCATEHLRAKLIQLLGWRAALKSCFKKYLPEFFLQHVRLMGNSIRSGDSSAMGGHPISRGRMFKLVGELGESEELICEQRKELADIELTLQSREFLDFLQQHASELLFQKQNILSGSGLDRGGIA